MSTQQGCEKPSTNGRRIAASCRFWSFAICLLPFAFGCTWDRWNLFTPPPAPPPPAESLVLRGDKLEADTTLKTGKGAPELAGAEDLYRKGDYATAKKIFHGLAENSKNSPQVCEEARFYEAECLRRQKKYPDAADTYHKLLIDFPQSSFRDQGVQHMFDIANYWLEDTRKEMQEIKEREDGKRWVVWPEWVHVTDSTKPFFDEEGRALETLEQVRYNDMMGPLAPKALFLTGSIKFFHRDYKDAEHAYSQLVEWHPNSPLAPQALKLAVISKELSTGGPDYDARKLTEARKLVDAGFRSYPELASKDSDFLNRQLWSITVQQAEKDYRIAQFYERTGKPCSAYFYYEIVRRRYPKTKYFDIATERMNALRAKVEAEQSKATSKAPPPGAVPAAQNAAPPQVAGPGPQQLPPDMIRGR
ncbi:MAG TPA: tetratricopeptide repeat protein [Gemmataceae bacterium]|nr:tetratricopeptide repeat protein [Gemmataceae bacterium]